MQILKLLIKLCLGLILAAGVGLAAGYLHFIWPHRADIEALASSVQPPPQLYTLALQAESKAGIGRYAARLLAQRHCPESRIGIAYWGYVFPALYPEKTQFKLWVRLAPYQGGEGLEAAAQHFYGRPLQALNRPQLAELVVMVRSPSYFAPGSEQNQRRAQALLGQVPGP